MNDWLKSADARELRRQIDWHLEQVSDDRELRNRLEGMAATSLFRALAWFWAPRLYARNRAMFRPFIAQHFAQHYVPADPRKPWLDIQYAGEIAQTLDPWLALLEREMEAPMFRRVYAWKHRGPRGWGVDAVAWQRDLVRQFSSAAPTLRGRLLDLYNLPAMLEESAATSLYEADGAVAGPFILRHLPRPGWIERKLQRPARWKKLEALARQRGDEAFAWKLYRQQVEIDDWLADALLQCQRISDPAQLNQALEDRHPEGQWKGLGKPFHRLMEARGLDILPYLRRHLRSVFGLFRAEGYDDMAALARRRQWIDFWAALVVTCGTAKDYNAAIAEVLKDGSLSEAERQRRLALLSGVSREWNGLGWGLARVQMLNAQNALELYRRYRDLLQQNFKAQVTPSWGESYLPLFEQAWAANDEEMADYLASRYLTQSHARGGSKENVAELATEKYLSLKLDDRPFARRAANVLTLVPAYSIYNYDQLIRDNRFARLLFERSLRGFLADAAAVRDLVEGGEIHVQMLAYRVLALPDPRARELARDNLDILIGTVLRVLQRRTRLAAFAALDNAASTEDSARRVLERCREAFALPDERYPKEALVGLIAGLLRRYPSLAAPGERPRIHRRAA